MKSKGHNVPAAAKRWMSWVAKQLCVNCGATGVHVHHCAGATAKHNKVEIGDWWILPFCPECHQDIHGERARFFYCETRKETEKLMFDRLMHWAESDSALLDAPRESVVHAIMDYHR